MQKKIFVGGLSWDTSDESFRLFFGAWGPVDSAVVKRTPCGGSRGFGFVVYQHQEPVDKLLKESSLCLDGRKIEVRNAVPRGALRTESKRIFVGGLSAVTTSEELIKYFSAFGEVNQGIVMMDKQTNRSRGFGFVAFANKEIANHVCTICVHVISGKRTDCRKAFSKDCASDTSDMFDAPVKVHGAPASYAAPPLLPLALPFSLGYSMAAPLHLQHHYPLYQVLEQREKEQLQQFQQIHQIYQVQQQQLVVLLHQQANLNVAFVCV